MADIDEIHKLINGINKANARSTPLNGRAAVLQDSNHTEEKSLIDKSNAEMKVGLGSEKPALQDEKKLHRKREGA